MRSVPHPFHYAALLAAALLTAALTAVAVRPWNLGALAWLAYLPLFAALRATAAPLLSAALGVVGALGVSSVAYEAAAGIGVAYYPLAALLATVPFAIAGAGTSVLQRRLPSALAWCVAPLLWVVAELVPAQPALLGRFALPLTMIGYSQAELPALHLARFSSVTATSVAILLANALLLELLLSFRVGRMALRRQATAASGCAPPVRSARRSTWASALGLAGVATLVWAAWVTRPAQFDFAAQHVGSQIAPASIPAAEPASFRVSLVQPHQPTALLAAAHTVPQARTELLRHLFALSSQRTSTSDLTIWPEAAWPGRLTYDAKGVAGSSEAIQLLGAHPPILFGAAGMTAGGKPSNAAFTWTGVQLRHAYDKVHLVPIGENGLQPGDGFRLERLAGVLVAPLICYDVVFPGLARAAARGGAELLAVLTDDAFAALGDVPLQHLRVAIFRAVETGLPLAFAANTGPSAILGRNGDVLASAAAGEATTLAATLGLGTGSTPYLRYGNWVGALASLLVALLAALGAARVAGMTGGARY